VTVCKRQPAEMAGVSAMTIKKKPCDFFSFVRNSQKNVINFTTPCMHVTIPSFLGYVQAPFKSFPEGGGLSVRISRNSPYTYRFVCETPNGLLYHSATIIRYHIAMTYCRAGSISRDNVKCNTQFRKNDYPDKHESVWYTYRHVLQ